MHDLSYALEILGLGEGSAEKDIRRAYARLAREHRPDVDPDGFSRIRAAYERALASVQENRYDALTLPDAPTIAVPERQLPTPKYSEPAAELSRANAELGGGLPDPYTGIEPDFQPEVEAQTQDSAPDHDDDIGSTARAGFLDLEQRIVAALQVASTADAIDSSQLLDLTNSYVELCASSSLSAKQHGEYFLANLCMDQPMTPLAFVKCVAQEMDVVDIPTTKRLGRVELAIHEQYLRALEVETFAHRTDVKGGFVARAVQHGGNYAKLLLFYCNEDLRKEFEKHLAWAQSLQPSRPDLFDQPTFARWQQVRRLDAINWINGAVAFVFTTLFTALPLLVAESQDIDLAGLDQDPLAVGVWIAASTVLGIGATLLVFSGGSRTIDFVRQLTVDRHPAAWNLLEVVLSVCALTFWALGDLHTLDNQLGYGLFSAALLTLAVLTRRVRSLAAVSVWMMVLYLCFFAMFLLAFAGLRIDPVQLESFLPLLVLTMAMVDERVVGQDDDAYHAIRLIFRGSSGEMPAWRAHRLLLGGSTLVFFLTLASVLSDLATQTAAWGLLTAITLVAIYADLVLLGSLNRDWPARAGYLLIACWWFVPVEQPDIIPPELIHLVPQVTLLCLLLYVMYVDRKRRPRTK